MNCSLVFIIFMVVVCVLKFIGSTGRVSNFLVGIRCVEERDKAASMGFGVAFSSLLAFIPGPIFYGWLIDTTCVVWGKTCSGTGNCWVYDSKSMRLLIIAFSVGFITLGTLFDIFVWYYCKDLKIFDEGEEGEESNGKDHEKETVKEKDEKLSEEQPLTA